MQTNEDQKVNEQNGSHQEVDDASQIKYFGGHEYDGIKELDNPLPPWLKYIFYITIILAFSYWTRLFVFHDDNIIQRREYAKEMAVANAKTDVAVKEEASRAAAAAPLTKEQILSDGKVTFDKICFVCHGKFGEGLVGPNFTDDYWIKGGRPEDLKKVITEGVLDKGMLSYKSQLNNAQIDHVIAYILSLQGTNPPNPKAPQGVKVEK
ncbi:MAG: cbb3-type cytochrome c oxidase N-terminal domain-containing protein [Bacteroidota bacterium]|nr:cbb3-type cytochrome c oxidase N-terminal domain-containing protein [Bacteroidota bacterium]